MALENQRRVKVLASRDFYAAAEYAANKSWWLHAWTWLETETDEVVEYTRDQF